jgi:hypothetical protein
MRCRGDDAGGTTIIANLIREMLVNDCRLQGVEDFVSALSAHSSLKRGKPDVGLNEIPVRQGLQSRRIASLQSES